VSAIQGTITKFASLADGTLRLQVDVHHGDTSAALGLLCEVGTTVALARLVEEQTDQERYDSVTTTGSGRQVDDEEEEARPPINSTPTAVGSKRDPLTGQILKHFYMGGFFQSPKVLRALADSDHGDIDFLLWLKSQVCWHCGKQEMHIDEATGTTHFFVQAAHVRRVSAGAGTGIKPQFSAIPLCDACHTIQHAVGESGIAPREWWEEKAAKARQEWGHQRLREVFATDSVSATVSVDDLWAWLKSKDLLNYVPAKVRRSVEQGQRARASGSAGAVGEDAVVEG